MATMLLLSVSPPFMDTFRRIVLLTALLLVATLTTGISSADAASDEILSLRQITQEMIDWVRSEGGYFSEKLEIRPMDPNDETSPLGVFADDDIEEDETLMEIPRSCYLSLDENQIQTLEDYEKSGGEDMVTIMSIYFSNTCHLAHKYLEEMKKFQVEGKKSPHAPYLAYLETQRQGQLPATYSEAGKALLRKISGPTTTKSKNYDHYALPPYLLVDWIDEHFKKTGCIKADDPVEEHAVALAIQRGYDFEFVPIWDMVNHDNANLNTENSAIHSGDGLEVWASEDIDEGEEIFATYNFCTDCKDYTDDDYTGDEWGTPGIYRDFGFVEQTEQLWAFLDHKIYFEIDEEGEINFDKDRGGKYVYGKPDSEGLEFLKEQLERLEAMETDLKELPEGLPQHEWNSINQYYESLVKALRLVIEKTNTLNKDELASSISNDTTASSTDNGPQAETAEQSTTSEQKQEDVSEVCSA